jgi:hypothetical protein
MDNKVRVSTKCVWGSTYYYPECSLSRMLCEISRKKTLTKRVIELIKVHGYELEILPDEV